MGKNTKNAEPGAPDESARESLAERIRAIGRDTASRWKEPYRSMTLKELDDLLYDELGLPK